MLVFVHIESSVDGRAASVTYNGVNCTKAIAQVEGRDESSIWYMLDTDLPSTGTYDVVVTISDSSGNEWYTSGAISFTGVDQSAPEATNGSSDINATSISTNITPISTNTRIYDILGLGADNDPTVVSGQTEEFDVSGASGRGACSHEVSSDTTQKTLGWTFSSTNRIAHAVVVIAEASAGGGLSTAVPQAGAIMG